MQLFSKKLSEVNLVLLVAAFLTLTGNFTFFEKTLQIYPLSENWLFLGSLFLFLFTFLATLLIVFCFRWSVKPILILLLLISAVVTYSTNNFGIVFDHNMITNTFETDTSEFSDLVSIKSIIYFCLLGLIPSIYVWKIQLVKASIKTQLWQRIKMLLTLIVVFVIVVLSFSKHYSSFARENRDLRLYITPTYFLYSSIKFIDSQIETSAKPFKEIGLDAIINKKSDKRRLVIFVIGETARRDRMSINGYDRKTNPYLEQEDIISFSGMTACGTDTALSVPCMFSILNRDNYSHAKAKNMSNVLEIISDAGIEVLWLENNSDSKGVADRISYIDYKSEDVNPVCDIECRDEGMLNGLKDYIDGQNGKDVLVVMHTMGSHGPAYYKRYPSPFEVFSPACQTNQLNECSNEEINNAYDNTIVYVDYVLSRLINLFKKYPAGKEIAIIYISDHGESLGESGIYLHGMPYLIAPIEQKQVAALMWFNEELLELLDINIISEKIDLPLSHDNLFHTLLGIMNIKTALYQDKMDIIAQ